MLTVHDCTFQMHWTGWGSASIHAERVAADVMLDLIRMSPENIKRLARSPRELTLTSRVARTRVAIILAHRGKKMPPKANIFLEAR